VAEGVGLENRYTRKGIVGSNPTLSVIPQQLTGMPSKAPISPDRVGVEFRLFSLHSNSFTPPQCPCRF
jgi:hypothetical protein